MNERGAIARWCTRAGVGVLLAASLTAQEAAFSGAFAELRTPDGSRFLLVPTGGPPVVHWMVATPAGVLEDPPELAGLSFAVARASLLGTTFSSSRDAQEEERVLAEQDRLEQELDRRMASRENPTDLLAELTRVRAQALNLSDPASWERQLRRAPALGTELRELPDAELLHITTTVRGLPRVAQLLMERREGTVLRGVHHHLRIVRAEQQRARGTEVEAAMRREVLGLRFIGHPFANAWAATDQPAPLPRARALEVFQRTQHPTRTLHVLTGGFDLTEVKELVDGLFTETQLPPPPAPVAAPERGADIERRSSIRGGKHPAVTIGFRVPDGIDPDVLATTVEWLAGPTEAEILTRLRIGGHPDATVRGTLPFPSFAAGLFLLEVADPNAARGAPDLLRDLEKVLLQIASEAPRPAEIERARTRLSSAEAASRLSAEDLAFRLAIDCGLRTRTPEQSLNPPRQVDVTAVQKLAQTMLAPKNRTTVVLEVAP